MLGRWYVGDGGRLTWTNDVGMETWTNVPLWPSCYFDGGVTPNLHLSWPFVISNIWGSPSSTLLELFLFHRFFPHSKTGISSYIRLHPYISHDLLPALLHTTSDAIHTQFFFSNTPCCMCALAFCTHRNILISFLCISSAFKVHLSLLHSTAVCTQVSVFYSKGEVLHYQQR